MRIFATLGMGAFFLVGLTVGVRLLASGVRERQLPETLMGVGLLLLGPLGFPIAVAGLRLQTSQPELGAIVLGGGMALVTLGGACTALFTHTVFHPRSGTSRALLVVIVAALLSCWFGTLTTTGFDMRGREMAIFGKLGFAFRATVTFWAAMESLQYWRQMRRRLPLGLADPLTTNRFALWGMAMGAACALGLITLFNANRGGAVVMSDELNALISLGGSFAAVTLYLAFVPPDSYRRLIESRAARVVA